MPDRTPTRRWTSWWRSWRKEERRTPINARNARRGLLLSLGLLTPLLTLHVMRRSQEALREHQGQRDDTLALMEAALSTAERNVRDWAHWDDAYSFVRGENPGYRAAMDASSIFEGGTIQVILRPDGSTLMIQAAPSHRLRSYEALVRCARDNRLRLPTIASTVRLACRGNDGSLFLGAITPITDSLVKAPAVGTLALLDPLLKREFTPRIRERLTTLARELIFLPAASAADDRRVELIRPLVHSSGDTLAALRRENILPIVAGSLIRDLPLLLAVPALALILRILALLEARRQRIRQRQVERLANQRIRRTCHQLDRLMQSVVPADETSTASPAILGRLSLGEGQRVSPEEPAPGDGDTSAPPLARVSRRFQHFLSRASQLALNDALTQLPNRRYFIEQLAAAVNRGGIEAEGLALLFIDIDRFKFINDTYGHTVGDAVLVCVSERLQQVLRPGDFMARYGGDELAVILDLSECGDRSAEGLSQAARGRAESMIACLSDPVEVGDLVIAVSLSIGITLVDPSEPEITTVIQRSDLAMYQAKRSRHTRIIGPEDLVEIPHLNSYRLFTDLIQAIGTPQLQIFFQPIGDTEGRWQGLEALARWQHPGKGWIDPPVFLELAEQHRQMQVLGKELIRLTLEGYRSLQALQPGLRLYMNLSPSQLLDPGLAADLLLQLGELGLRPSQLVLELTENSILEPNPSVLENLRRMREAGMGLALDDFGTGYSSLVLLRTLHPDVVKIDKSFTRDLDETGDARHIIGLIADLAPRLQLELIAEGIEDQATMRQLQQLGIKLFQGFLLARPAPAHEWREHLGRDQAASSRWIV